jgi:RNA-directed DNA polymerase
LDCHGAKHSQNGVAKLQSRKADKRVRQNGGAAGIDGMKIADFPDFLRRHWETLRRKLLDGTYAPSPVRRVELIRFAHPAGSLFGCLSPSGRLPKADGSKRPLGIPTVLDRVIQQAIAQILTPIYEPVFSDHSFGC